MIADAASTMVAPAEVRADPRTNARRDSPRRVFPPSSGIGMANRCLSDENALAKHLFATPKAMFILDSNQLAFDDPLPLRFASDFILIGKLRSDSVKSGLTTKKLAANACWWIEQTVEIKRPMASKLKDTVWHRKPTHQRVADPKSISARAGPAKVALQAIEVVSFFGK
jgi:hypothetical protein